VKGKQVRKATQTFFTSHTRTCENPFDAMNALKVRAMLGTMRARHKLRKRARARHLEASWPRLAGTFSFREEPDAEPRTVMVEAIPRSVAELRAALQEKLERTVVKMLDDKGQEVQVDAVLAELVFQRWNQFKDVELSEVREMLSAFATGLRAWFAATKAREKAESKVGAPKSNRVDPVILKVATAPLATVVHQLWEFSCRSELHAQLLGFVVPLCRVLRKSRAFASHAAAASMVSRLARNPKFSVTIKEARVVSALAAALGSAPPASKPRVAHAAVNCVAQLVQHKPGLHLVSGERGASLLVAAISTAVSCQSMDLLRCACPAGLTQLWVRNCAAGLILEFHCVVNQACTGGFVLHPAPHCERLC